MNSTFLVFATVLLLPFSVFAQTAEPSEPLLKSIDDQHSFGVAGGSSSGSADAAAIIELLTSDPKSLGVPKLPSPEELERLRSEAANNADLWTRAFEAIDTGGNEEMAELRLQLQERAEASQELADRLANLETSLDVKPGEIIEVVKLREKLDGMDKDTDRRFGEINSRLDSLQSLINDGTGRELSLLWGLIIALISAALSILATLAVQKVIAR